jgi:hypothetical protein
MTVLALAAVGSGAGAASRVALWTTVDASGGVDRRLAYDAEDQWSRLRQGDVLQPLTAVRTGRRGHAVLVTATGRLVLGPKTEVELPAPADGDAAGELLHSRGSVRYEVRRGGVGFDVLTPLVVVGTSEASFSIDVDRTTATVTVRQGSVGVRSRMDGSKVRLEPGDVASVDVERGGEPEVHRRVAHASRSDRRSAELP